MLKIRLRWNFQAQHGNQLLLSLSFQTAISLLGSSYSCLAVTQKQIFPSFGKFECNHLAALQLSQVNKIVFHLLGATFSSRQLKNHSNTPETCVLLPSAFCFVRFRMQTPQKLLNKVNKTQMPDTAAELSFFEGDSSVFHQYLTHSGKATSD